MDLPIIFRDARFAVLDKPPGLPVHPGPRGGASVEDGFPALARRGHEGPWLCHRLDADTSGCLVVALRRNSLAEAQAAFAEGLAEKTYWAVVEGVPQVRSGVIGAPLRKQTDRGGWRMVVDPAGQRAVTEYAVLGDDGARAWLELRPQTGRTHQIRVHCAQLGFPIVDDPIYGHAPAEGRTPLQLLARAIRLPLEPPLEAVAEPPAHMRAALRRCGWRDETQAAQGAQMASHAEARAQPIRNHQRNSRVSGQV